MLVVCEINDSYEKAILHFMYRNVQTNQNRLREIRLLGNVIILLLRLTCNFLKLLKETHRGNVPLA